MWSLKNKMVKKKEGQKKEKSSLIGEPGARADTLPAIFAVVAIISAVGLTEFVLTLPPANSLWIILGSALFLIGIGMRLIAQYNLGKYFSVEVVIKKGHKLVTHGIHRYIRHPMYTGMFMIFVGADMVLQSWIGLIVSVVMLIPLGIWRMRIEERVMHEEFGEAYTRYKKKSWAVLPPIW